MILIDNAKLVLETGIVWDGQLLTDGGRIAAFGERGSFGIPADAERIDAGGMYLGPGFVDIHVHGGGGHFFHEDPEKAAAHFLSHGETSILATLYYDLSKDDFLAAIDRVKTAMQTDGAASAIRGFYMEGPYMNPKYGGNPDKNQWRGEIRPEDFMQLVDRAGALARVWAVAPERDGLEPFLAYARHQNPNVVFAVGHSEATPEQIRALKHYGIRIQTHCMNATSSKSQWVGTRGCGPDEACLTDPDMYAEMISDSMGIHVNPVLQRLILNAKGIDKVILISDSFVSEQPSPEGLRHVTDLCFDANGLLAGSRLTLDVACRNLMHHTSCGIAEAFLLASRNPARAVGLYREVGSLAVGKRADLVIVDDQFHVRHVLLDGKLRK